MIDITFTVRARSLEELEEKAELTLLHLASHKHDPIDYSMNVRPVTYTYDSDLPALWEADVHATTGESLRGQQPSRYATRLDPDDDRGHYA